MQLAACCKTGHSVPASAVEIDRGCLLAYRHLLNTKTKSCSTLSLVQNLEIVASHAKLADDGKTMLYPSTYSDDPRMGMTAPGWANFTPTPMSIGALEVWYWSMDAADLVRQRSSLLKAVITAFPCVSLPFLAVPLRSHRT
eukprot:SAG22_NODE_2173_length_2893_cov_3.127774_5_plen_140_part_01